jgi:hypothetical protein
MLRPNPTRWLICAALLCAGLFPPADNAAGMKPRIQNKIISDITAATGPHPILVELFTSEGCSSCPPADQLLLNMDTAQPVPGGQLIVLSEHVDYWDHDGWKDPNSSRSLTERQATYVHALGLKTAYTPQIVVDGTSEMLINNSEQAIKVFQNAVVAPKIPVQLSQVNVDRASPETLRLRVDIDGKDDQKDADVYVAVALDRVESQVERGENKGRHLTHVAVVQQLAKVGNLSKGKSFAQEVQLKLKPGTDTKNIRIVAFVQELGPSKVLGVAVSKPAA